MLASCIFFHCVRCVANFFASQLLFHLNYSDRRCSARCRRRPALISGCTATSSAKHACSKRFDLSRFFFIAQRLCLLALSGLRHLQGPPATRANDWYKPTPRSMHVTSARIEFAFRELFYRDISHDRDSAVYKARSARIADRNRARLAATRAEVERLTRKKLLWPDGFDWCALTVACLLLADSTFVAGMFRQRWRAAKRLRNLRPQQQQQLQQLQQRHRQQKALLLKSRLS